MSIVRIWGVDEQHAAPRGAGPHGAVERLAQPHGNRGLYAERIGPVWDFERKKGGAGAIDYDPQGQPKFKCDTSASPTRIAASEVGDQQMLPAYARRLKSLAASRGGAVKTFHMTSAFATGLGAPHPLENGLTWHHTLGAPYMPGSGVKGLLQAYLHQWTDFFAPESTQRAEAIRLFGCWRPEKDQKTGDKENRMGALIFLDAVPVARVKVEADVMTQHTRDYYNDGPGLPNEGNGPNPIPFLVARDAAFQFAIMPARPTPAPCADCVAMMTHLAEALKIVGLGAKTKSGYGRFVEKL
jgi:CRISPR-associated protein Cmr6